MLRIVTFNANGIRSAAKKGFWEWFEQQQADILCIQELKAQEADLDEKVLNAQGYHVFMHCAQNFEKCHTFTTNPNGICYIIEYDIMSKL